MLIYLENIYLCGINNNGVPSKDKAVLCCDLLENIYLCGINNNTPMFRPHGRGVPANDRSRVQTLHAKAPPLVCAAAC